MSCTLITGLRDRPGCSPRRGALLAVQVVVGADGVAHPNSSLMTDEIVTYDAICQSSASDEILKTDCLCYGGRVSEQQTDPVNRLERRKQRTRAALIQAAQTFLAAGKSNVPVLEITQAADVGMGSFYNHFDSKEELFEAAVADVLDNHGALLDQLTARIDDPAETFACSFRLTGRLFRRRPQESQILLANGLS